MRGKKAGSYPAVFEEPSAFFGVVLEASRFLYTCGRFCSAARTGMAMDSVSPTSMQVES